MTPDPTPLATLSPSPMPERPSGREALLQALRQRDPVAVTQLSRRWVHRHGVDALERLMGELGAADAGLSLWWKAQLGDRDPGAPFQPASAPIAPADAEPEPPSPLGGEITLTTEPAITTLAALDGSERPLHFEPLPALGGLIDVDLDALARDAFVLATPDPNPEPPVIPPLARFQPSVEIPQPPTGQEQDSAAAAATLTGGQAGGEPTGAEEAGGEEAAPAAHPLTRFRSLVRDCIDEVARTFQGNDGFERPSPEPLPPAASQQPPASDDTRPLSVPEPPPLVIGGARSGAAGRPAPAPSHPDLASLRSWLPDGADHHQRRAS